MKVSVAICTYNGADYLSEQIDSILSQSRQPDEIVVRDDGSTDRTIGILEEFASENPSIFDVRQNEANKGIIKNFEGAISACSGEYIALSDQDDIWDPSKLERQIEALQETDNALVCHNSTLVTNSLEPVGELWDELAPPYSPQSQIDPTTAVCELTRRNFVQGATIMFDAAWRDDLLPIPEGWAHDHYLALQAALHEGLTALDDSLLRYRQHNEQEVSGQRDSAINQFLDNLQSGYDNSRVERWGEIRDWITSHDNSEMAPEKSVIERLLNRKVVYEKRRHATLCESNLLQGFWGILQNLRSGSYSTFENGIWTAANDTAMVGLSPFRDA